VNLRIGLGAVVLATLALGGTTLTETATPTTSPGTPHALLSAPSLTPTPSLATLPTRTLHPSVVSSPTPRPQPSQATALPTRQPARAVTSLPTMPPPSVATPDRDGCDPAYPDRRTCIPPGPPFDQGCAITDERTFTVLAPDPQGLDHDKDGIGCEPMGSG
jgi:hypothetical protein